MIYPRPYHQQWAELKREPGSSLLHGACRLAPWGLKGTRLGQGAIAMTCSLEGTLFGKAAVGNCVSAAVSMMEIAALIWVLEREEMGSRTIRE